ncbi:MAG: flagellar protein FliS [Lachnospiraceae bacterium]
MTNELKKEYAVRITQANKTQMIVILYEMLLTYVTDAKTAHNAEDKAEFQENIKRAKACLDELTQSLHLEYEIAGNLLQLYLYVNRSFNAASRKQQTEPLEDIISIISELCEAYIEVSKQDDSEPMMSHTQSIYAGLTYSKNELTENLSGESNNRGFLA